jgi:hypothetical protein
LRDALSLLATHDDPIVCEHVHWAMQQGLWKEIKT